MSKKKLVSLCIVVAMVLTAIAGGTLAYFTDEDAQTNTFTAGNVGINLDEVVVEKNDTTGNYDATDVRTGENQDYELYPGMTVAKDPTITVDGTNDAYVAAKVTITGDLYDLIGIAGYDTLNIHAIASGGLLEDQEGAAYGDYNGLFVFQNDNYAIHQVKTGDQEWTLYVFMKEAQATGAEIVLFDTLTIPANWDNAEMEKINGMEINVEAYATQTNGMADCYDAMTKAFPEDFAF